MRANCMLVPMDDALGFELSWCLPVAAKHRHGLGFEEATVESVPPTSEEAVAMNG